MKKCSRSLYLIGLDPPAVWRCNMDIIDILALAQLQELIYNASKDA